MLHNCPNVVRLKKYVINRFFLAFSLFLFHFFLSFFFPPLVKLFVHLYYFYFMCFFNFFNWTLRVVIFPVRCELIRFKVNIIFPVRCELIRFKVNITYAAIGARINVQRNFFVYFVYNCAYFDTSQICIYYLLCIAAVNYTSNLEITTTRSRDCPSECICLSPKQVGNQFL